MSQHDARLVDRARRAVAEAARYTRESHTYADGIMARLTGKGK